MFTEWQDKAIDRLVDAIDALIIMRAERADLRGAAEEAADDCRVALADAVTDLIQACREDA